MSSPNSWLFDTPQQKLVKLRRRVAFIDSHSTPPKWSSKGRTRPSEKSFFSERSELVKRIQDIEAQLGAAA